MNSKRDIPVDTPLANALEEKFEKDGPLWWARDFPDYVESILKLWLLGDVERIRLLQGSGGEVPGSPPRAEVLIRRLDALEKALLPPGSQDSTPGNHQAQRPKKEKQS